METVIEKQVDKFGNEIKVGDKVAFVSRGWDGKRADIGRGTVTKLTPCGARIKADKEYEKLCPYNIKYITYIEDKNQKTLSRREIEYLPKFSTSKLIIKL
jgi:hypothetical protein